MASAEIWITPVARARRQVASGSIEKSGISNTEYFRYSGHNGA